MSNKIIIPTGYMGSGSSAITDIITEIDGFSAPNNSFEYIFMHCPDGVFDLEDKLLKGNNVLRSDEAIYRFLTMMHYLFNTPFYWPGSYNHHISTSFYDYCVSFINSITDISFNDSYWYFQELPQTPRMRLLLFLRAVSTKFFPQKNTLIKRPLLYKTIRVSFPSRNDFYKASHEFLYSILCDLGINKSNLVLDQFLLPHNLFRIDNYFNKDTRVIVVERDPRDVFILNKYVWSQKGGIIPFPFDVKKFVSYYRHMRESEIIVTDSRILRVHFEDFIYHYNDSIKKLYNFLNISSDSHAHKFHNFNPTISIKNTQIYRTVEVPQEELHIIERDLNEFLYPFPKDISPNCSFKDLF